MRLTAPCCMGTFSLVACLLAPGSNVARAADASELDQFEERTLVRATEKALRAAKSDRLMWIKELEGQFGNRVGNPLKEEEYGEWFDMVADKGGEWRRENAPTSGFKELYDRALQRLEMGPVPTLKREEFLKYARRALIPGNPPEKGAVVDPHEDADKVFRVLDKDGDGVLEVEELTTKLREDRKAVDTDGNGRIDKDEYRAYFSRRVKTSVEAALAKPSEKDKERGSDTKTPAKAGKTLDGLPSWFAELDTKKDGQITLSEWRKSGRPIAQFLAMDLNGDGLLTKEEYQRYVKLKEQEDKEELPGVPPVEK